MYYAMVNQKETRQVGSLDTEAESGRRIRTSTILYCYYTITLTITITITIAITTTITITILYYTILYYHMTIQKLALTPY